jgi:membrane protein YdbS with pleckstrin-like domain
MTEELPRRLARKAPWVWGAQQALFWGALLIGVLIVGSEADVPGALALIPLAGFVVGGVVVPPLRWRAWRWDVRPDAIELRRGVLRVRHTVVPMLRVQHVDTTSDVLEQAFDLASVVVHTAAGSHTIPLLRDVDAEDVRRQIAKLSEAVDEP